MLYSIVASGLLMTASASNVDVEGAFYQYCHSYCGGGGFATCDIGNGNIGVGTKSLMAEAPQKVLPGKPALNSSRLLGATGTGCDEKSDPKSCKNGLWCDFSYKCTAPNIGYEGVAYSNIITKAVDTADGFVFTHWVDNDTPSEQSTKVKFDESTSSSASISLTETIDVGFSVTIKADIPEIMASAQFTEKLDVSVSSTQAHTLTNTQAWNIEQPVIARVNTTVKATLVIQKVMVSGDWSATMVLPETAKLWCNNKVNGHWEWFIPSAFYLPAPCTGDRCPVRGKFSGFHGVSSSVTLKECPLYSRDC